MTEVPTAYATCPLSQSRWKGRKGLGARLGGRCKRVWAESLGAGLFCLSLSVPLNKGLSP